MKNLMRVLAAAFLAALLCAGCIITPAPDYREEIAPPLPAIVELDGGPYYHYRNYHYRFQNDRWHYSREMKGPWRELPRSHWPREIRRGGAGEGRR